MKGFSTESAQLLTVIGSLFSKGEEPPYSLSQIDKEAKELGVPLYLYRNILKGLVRRGLIYLVKKSGTLHVYPTSHTFLHPPVEEACEPGSGGVGSGTVTPKDLLILEIIDALYSKGKRSPPYSMDLIRKRYREDPKREEGMRGSPYRLVESLTRLSREGKIRLVSRSEKLYVYPAAYTSSHTLMEEPYRLDLRRRRKGEAQVLIPWDAPHKILGILDDKYEEASLRDIEKKLGSSAYTKDMDALWKMGLVEVPSSYSSWGPSVGSHLKDKGFKITGMGQRVLLTLDSGKRAGFTQEELGTKYLE